MPTGLVLLAGDSNVVQWPPLAQQNLTHPTSVDAAFAFPRQHEAFVEL